MIKFGTDGWRAVIGDDFTFENVRIVSQAIADYLKKQPKKTKRVIVGYDRRFLSKEFAMEVSRVLSANGIRIVLSSSAVPTPVVSFEALYNGYDLGVMITASHNPAKFNGLKIKTRDGGAADKALTNKVESLFYKRKPKLIDFQDSIRSGRVKVKEVTGEYTNFLKKFVNLSKIKRLKLKILVDNMYGVGGSFAQDIINSSTVEIDYLHNEFNPSFGGTNPEPIEDNLKEIIKKVKKDGYDLGIVLDGDADRIAAVNKNGEFINAQVLLPLLAIHMVKNRKETGGIAKTVVGSNLIDDVAFSLGIPCYETPVGFKYISGLFKQKLISIGGEEAGGIGFKDYIPERDGTASFLMLLEMIAWEKKNFDQLLNDLWKKYGKWYYARTYFLITSVRKSLSSLKLPQELLGKKVQRVNTSDGIKVVTKDNWLMFRKSGTEPIVRVYAEAKSKKGAMTLINIGKRMIKEL